MTDLFHWTPRPTPGLSILSGRRVRLEPLDPAGHGDGLFATIGGADNSLWEWMPVGPFATREALLGFLETQMQTEGWRCMTIRAAASGEVLGMAAYMRIREAHGSAEIGCVAFGPKLRRTPEATEALYLMADHAFAHGYRRYEWKCNALNLPSRRAAQRLGFSYEGIFRQHMVIKGKNRDSAWFAIIDTEWPALREAYGAWLSPANFTAEGRQRERLSDLTALVRAASDPAL